MVGIMAKTKKQVVDADVWCMNDDVASMILIHAGGHLNDVGGRKTCFVFWSSPRSDVSDPRTKPSPVNHPIRQQETKNELTKQGGAPFWESILCSERGHWPPEPNIVFSGKTNLGLGSAESERGVLRPNERSLPAGWLHALSPPRATLFAPPTPRQQKAKTAGSERIASTLISSGVNICNNTFYLLHIGYFSWCLHQPELSQIYETGHTNRHWFRPIDWTQWKPGSDKNCTIRGALRILGCHKLCKSCLMVAVTSILLRGTRTTIDSLADPKYKTCRLPPNTLESKEGRERGRRRSGGCQHLDYMHCSVQLTPDSTR